MDILAKKLEAYFLSKNWHIDRQPDAVNIAYIEGANADGTPNADRPDEWNDRRIVFMYLPNGEPFISHNSAATTEPGVSATNSKKAAALGGVARVQFGQFHVWQMGYHKRDTSHPALVQVSELYVTRDRNRDGKRTDDLISRATGINQHGTEPGINSRKVGRWSEGCLVGQYWSMHLNFIDLCKADPRYIANPKYLFHTAVINGDEFGKFKI